MLMEVKIVANGKKNGMRVYDKKTGEELKNLTKVRIEQEVGCVPLAWITQIAVVDEMEVTATRTMREKGDARG